ncbi:Target of rapamycin, partial [Trichinella pseudospiralis]
LVFCIKMTAPAEYFLQRLCTKDEFARIQAAYDLYWYVKCELTEVPQEVSNAFREKFDFIIPELLTSHISGDRSAAIFAIVCLAQGDASFSNVAPANLRQTNPAGVASIRFHRYTHYLRNILPSSDANLVQLAVRAGAHLALRLSNLYTTEYVYFELKRATEWLQSASTDRTDNRLSAVIMMKELAYIAPTFFYQHTPHFFDCIFEALMDNKVQIRERAAEAIRAALVVTTQRETKLEQKIHWHKQCYNEANRFFEEARSSHASVREDRVHGGLLVLNELLRNANSRWERIIQEIAESNISRSAILAHNQELPKDFDFKERFTDLQEDVIAPLVSPSYFMNYESRNCRMKIAEEFNEICSTVTWCCNSTKANYNVQLQLALLCRLAAFDPQKFVTINFAEAVNYLWSCMTREKLRPDCLVAIGLFFMALKEEMVPYLPKLAFYEITTKIPSLKKIIEQGLLEQIYCVLLQQKMPNLLTLLQPIEPPTKPVVVTDPHITSLALTILGTFPFQRFSLESFLHRRIRLMAFQCLTDSDAFCLHLAQDEVLKLIMMGLQDEDCSVREKIIHLLGKLTDVNPAYCVPALRRILMQIIEEMSLSGLSRNEEQSARLFSCLVRCAPSFVKPYAKTAFELMPDKIEGYLDALLPVLIQLAQDTASMWALSKVIECTGFAVEPHKRYQDLLDLLLRTLKSEQSPDIRRETIRLIGFIGALDPYKQKALHRAVDLASNCTGLALSLPHIKDITDRRLEILQWFHWERCSLEQFYPTFAIINLMSILSDSTYNQQLLTAAVHSLVFIYYSLNDKGLTALDQVFPTLVNIIRNSDPSMREEFWTTKTQMRLTIILLVEQLAAALGSQFKPYAASIIPSMLRIFLHDTSVGRSVTSKLLDAFKKTSFILEDHLHLLLPPILSLAENVEVPIDVRRSAIETIDVFGETTSLSNFACRTVQTMVRVIDSEPELRIAAMDLFCTLILHLGEDFLPFCRVIDPCLERNDVVHERYISLILKTMEIGKINPTEEKCYKAMVRGRRCMLAKQQQVMQIEVRKVVCNVEQLRKIWLTNRCVSKEDWIAWLKRFSIQLLKESPVPALRSCYSVAVNHYQLASDLFNSAFASCWPELSETYQDELIETLQLALSASECPEIIQAILNLAEFIDHTEKGPLPIDPKLLGEKALETRAFAKALRCKEAEFYNEVTPEVLESLISINNMLQLRESSIGIVEIVRKRGIKVKDTERWYEKLNDWDKALEAYEAKQNQFPDDMELTLGRMRCLEALGNWSKVNEIIEKKWHSSTVEYKEKMAHIATCSAWGLGKWEAMQDYIAEISQSTVEGCFYRAVLAVHHQNFCEAQFRIDQARDLLDNELTAMLSESYSRAYESIVMVQMLSELEETIDVKRNPEKRRIVPSVWWNRLQGCQRSVEDWQRILQVRSLVLTPDEMRQMLLKFASLCRKSGKLAVSRRTILTLMDCDPDSSAPVKLPFERPEVCYAYCKQLNCEGRRDLALSQLQLLLEYGFKKPATLPAELLSLKARCFLKLGQWSEQNLINEDSPNVEVMQHYMYATELDSRAYKPWNALACANFNALLYYRQRAPIPLFQCQNDNGDSPLKPLNPNLLVPGTVPDDSVITILLTLWFDYGHIPEVYDTLISRIKTVRVETWLQVIPQLIARIDTPRHFVSHLIIEILMDIGKNHPQALIYPLTVASKSSSSARRQAAERVLKHMNDHSPNLVQQASMVSDELVRVAILWHELWHEALEEASRLFFSDRNVKGMLDLLNPLHALIERGATTMKEQSFNQAYYRDLKEAQELCIKFRQRGNLRDVTQAWDLYYNVFRRITKQLPLLSSLDLQYVSPKLLKCKNLELAVPGTYDPSRPLVCIQSVQRSLQVIASKQRPRKICINGSDGQEYWFLLKGHEDTRQDERVMQLFGLVNTILLQNPTTCRLNLTIQRYSVIPLSPNSGLIGWVPNCDTLHALLRDYREKKKILLNLEHRIMQRVAPDYDHLPLMQKVEVFEFALEHTPGDDLQKILWLKSPNSEVWFDRRTNYTRSLATMSMVGYILGLGDRHPSNLMLERMSGKIVHIDFGDCFEVAINREKFPEKIPFRLTRMLINAMEVTGVEGNFRLTCEKVMSTLRANRESIMAVLEAFVYDPLFSWKLIEREQFDRKTKNVSLSDDDAISLLSGGPGFQPSEFVSRKALDIIQRIRDKLTGRDFSSACSTTSKSLTVQAQVDLLIQQALSHENLCQCYIGWCPFW